MKTKSKSKSGVKHDANAMLKALKKEVKSRKLEVRSLHSELKEEEAALEKDKEASKTSQDASPQQQLKGNELLKLSHLTNMMGFEEGDILKHLEQEVRKLTKLQKEKQQDRRNMDINLKKMKEMNEQSERAVAAAEEQYKKLLAEAKKLKEQLDEAELKLYSAENKVKHSRGTKNVEITNKDSLRSGIKEIVHEVKRRCDDREVVIKVLKVAGKCLAVDMEVSMSALRGNDSDGDSGSSVDISSASSDEDEDD